MIGRLKSFWRQLRITVLMLWPARFTILIIAVLGLLLCLVDQAQDALFAVFAEGPLEPWKANSPWLFVLLTAFVAIQAWYWTRYLYDYLIAAPDHPRYQLAGGGNVFTAGTGFNKWFIEWIPRLLGASVFVLSALAVARCADWSGDPLRWSGVLLGGGALFLLLTKLRRNNLEKAPTESSTFSSASSAIENNKKGAHWLAWGAIVGWAFACVASMAPVFLLSPSDSSNRRLIVVGLVIGVMLFSLIISSKMQWTSRRHSAAVGVLCALSVLLLGISVFGPGLAANIGPAAVLLASAASWIGIVNYLLIFPSEALAVPVATAILAISFAAGVASLKFGADYGAHAVRLLPEAQSVANAGDSDPRLSLEQAYVQWWRQAPCGDVAADKCAEGAEKPLLLVASEGGASRAAFWSALALGALEDVRPGFHKSVFAMSGVSGGSLGVAVYQNLLRGGATPRCGRGDEEAQGFARCSQMFIDNDFLSPVFARMLQTDFIGNLLPGALFEDRAESLERSWETTWDRVFGDKAPGFDEALAVRPAATAIENPEKTAPQNDWLPILLLNGASQKGGRRIITSDIAVAPCNDDADLRNINFPDSVDFFCLTRHKIRLSTAALNSARFPYVSPPGAILKPKEDGSDGFEAVDRILDGGYFETLGGTTLTDMIPRLKAIMEAHKMPASIIVLALENAPDPVKGVMSEAKQSLKELNAENLVPDLLGPPVGLARARGGHGGYTRANLERNQHMNRRTQAYEVASPSELQGALAYFISFHVRDGATAGRKVDPSMSWFLSKRTTSAMLDDWCGNVCGAPDGQIVAQRRALAGALKIGGDPFNETMRAKVCARLARDRCPTEEGITISRR